MNSLSPRAESVFKECKCKKMSTHQNLRYENTRQPDNRRYMNSLMAGIKSTVDILSEINVIFLEYSLHWSKKNEMMSRDQTSF